MIYGLIALDKCTLIQLYRTLYFFFSETPQALCDSFDAIQT